jgi:hypothetical protein
VSLSRSRRTRSGDLPRILSLLRPNTGPWVSAALWDGMAHGAPPNGLLADEMAAILGAKLSPALLHYVRNSQISVTPELRAALEHQRFQLTHRSVVVAAQAGSVIQELGAVGVDAVVIKGPGIAAEYQVTNTRSFSDIDLLVEPRLFGRALTQLKGLGWYEESDNQQPWAFFDRYCREAVNLKHESGGSIDLHHRISPWLWSFGLSVAAVRERAVLLPVGGQLLPCADPVDNLMIACLHLINDHNRPGERLTVWRDIAQLGRRVDPADAASRIRAAGLSGYVSAILAGLPPEAQPSGLLAALPAERIPHPRRLRRLLTPRQGRQSVVDVHVLRLPVVNAGMYIAGTTVPSRGLIRRKYPESHGYLNYWTKAFRDRAHAPHQGAET